nr:hypothetical protein [uncultured Oscillibacter sp.]
MVKVTFQSRNGVYWAVCESVSRIQGSGFLLDSLQKDSSGGGPYPWAKVPEGWEIMFVEEA